MEKNLNDKTITELITELQCDEKIIEKALTIFKGQKVTICMLMHSSVNSVICFQKFDWTYLVGFNEQQYIYISEQFIESMTGNNIVFDIDNIDEAQYNNNTLKIYFKDGLQMNCEI